MTPCIRSFRRFFRVADGLESGDAAAARQHFPAARRRRHRPCPAPQRQHARGGGVGRALHDRRRHLAPARGRAWPTRPGPGDLIRSGDGRQWTVLEVRRTTLDALAVHHPQPRRGLRPGRHHHDPQGRPTPRATAARRKRPGFPGGPGCGRESSRCSPAAAASTSRGRRSRRCHIFVEDELALDPTHRIAGPDGTIYKVLGVTGAERAGRTANHRGGS